MEKRAILAALLMAGLLMLYQLLFVRPPEPQQAGKQVEPPAGAPAPAAPQPAPPQASLFQGLAREAVAAPAGTGAIVDTPLYHAEIAAHGGAFSDWQLHYRGEKPMVNGLARFRGVTLLRAGAPPVTVELSAAPKALRLGPDAPQGEIRLVGEDGQGLRVTQTLRFQAGSYVVDGDLRVENRHTAPQSLEIVLPWVTPVEWPKDQTEKFQGQHPTRAVRLAGGSVSRQDLASVPDWSGSGQWVGLESEWYLAAIIPRSAGFQLSEGRLTETVPGAAKPSQTAYVAARAALGPLGPGQAWEGRVSLYVGPKEYDRLKALGIGLEKSIYFGGFPLPQAYGGLPMEWLVVPILWLMHLFYGFTRNYGVAIILLTVITKVLFFPLTLKSMASMRAMQALQPQINALRSKYKSDPQRLQRETMELYRAHKVNPLGGCLPMVVQVPIFYALYVALSVAVEIQNAPFICFGRLFGIELWICDLAAHDPTYVLPLLMGASMFIQQKMTPTMGDPRQAKIMLMMPVVFTFMFLTLPSGLVLYWTLSNVLQIAQQKYMERTMKPAKVPARAAKKA
jgi:YidC/Oxa1 family membrane protein insertase